MSEIDREVASMLAGYRPEVRDLAYGAIALVREIVPDAHEEIDLSAKLVGFTFIPGTYRGLILAISPQKGDVNITFSKGAELIEVDPDGLLEGTGKVARHIKNRSTHDLRRPGVRALIEAAVERTPRS